MKETITIRTKMLLGCLSIAGAAALGGAAVFADIGHMSGGFALLILLILVLLSLVVSTLIHHSISRSLSVIEDTMGDIAKGDLAKRVLLSSGDEIEALAHEFNVMAAKLEESYGELKKHTGELEQTKNRSDVLLKENYLSSRMLIQRDLELSHANTRLQELDQVKSEFVSVAAHQLRTPLTGIKWTLAILNEKEIGELNAEQKKVVEDAYKATGRLIDLINDLLNVARLEEGRFGFSIKKQSLKPIILKVVSRLLPRANEQKITLTVTCPRSIPLLAFDEEKMDIVIENLLDNAIKYTPTAGSISLDVSRKDAWVVIEVKDSGIGIPHDQHDRLFSKFFRAKNAQLLQTSGTGLGLYLTKNIVERHGGSLEFESEEGKGATFFVRLPIHTEDEKES